MIFLEIIFFVITFLLSITLAFYIPGRVILRNQKELPPLALFALSTILGMVMWGWQGFILGYLGLRFASYAYLLFFLFIFIKNKYYALPLPKRLSWKKLDLWIVLLIVIGTFGQNISYVQAGFFNAEGMLQVTNNAPDHYWHTSMIHEMVKRVPPFEPGMYGILKTNYHYWFNLVTAELIRVFHLPLFHTQYIGMYIFGSIMLGVMGYVLASLLLSSPMLARWMLFFFYFGGDASYWFAYFKTGTMHFQVPTIIEEGTIFMDNPPRAFSILIALAAIYFLFKYLDKTFKGPFILALLFGTLIGFKVYTGFALVGGLGVLGLYQLLFKRDVKTLLICGLAGILSAVIFLPVNAHSGGLFFLPFERPRDFITYKPLGFQDLEMRWRVYEEHGNIPRLIQLGSIMTLIYIVVQYGTKIIGFIPYKKTLALLGKEKLLFSYSAILGSLFIGIFFSQKAHVSDSFNFFLPATIFLVMFASLHLTGFMEKKHILLKILIVLVIVGVTIPRWMVRVNDYLVHTITPKQSVLSYAELDSYRFLKEHTPENSMVLVLNKGYFDSTSALVSIFADRPMYLSGQGVIVAHQAVNKEREATVKFIYTSDDPNKVNALLKKNHIDYLYFYDKNSLEIPIGSLQAKTVFTNKHAIIMKVTQ